MFSGEFIIQPYLEIGTFRLHYYGMIIGASVLLSYFISRANAWRFGISQEEVDKYAFWAVIVSFLCARLYYVIFEYGYFSEHPEEILQIWNGGLSIFGALIGGLFFTYFYTRKKAYTVWQLLDLAALGLPLGQALGRIGNFINYEAYGSETNLPWKMFVPQTERFHHPTFLYEAILNIILFIWLYKLRGKIKAGNLALSYLLGYSLIRFIVEFVRIDSFILAGLKVNQIMALLIFVVANIVLFARNKKVS